MMTKVSVTPARSDGDRDLRADLKGLREVPSVSTVASGSNVHTSKFGGGEIRGQIRVGDDDDHHDD